MRVCVRWFHYLFLATTFVWGTFANFHTRRWESFYWKFNCVRIVLRPRNNLLFNSNVILAKDSLFIDESYPQTKRVDMEYRQNDNRGQPYNYILRIYSSAFQRKLRNENLWQRNIYTNAPDQISQQQQKKKTLMQHFLLSPFYIFPDLRSEPEPEPHIAFIRRNCVNMFADDPLCLVPVGVAVAVA